MTVTVAVADPCPLYMDGVRAAIAEVDDLRLIGRTASIEHAIRLVAVHRPDLMILEVDWPQVDVAEVIPMFRCASSRTRYLVVSSSVRSSHVHRVLDSGVDGYVPRSVTACDLVRVAHDVAAGQRIIDPEIASLPPVVSEDDPLTEREREVVSMLVHGHTNRETAQRLFLSVRTVEAHRSRIYSKLGVHSRAELVAWSGERAPAIGS